MTIADPTDGTLAEPRLARTIGRWGLTGLTINCVVGAGLLGLPGKVFALADSATGWVVAAAGVLALAAALCLAELGSRMDGSGGPVEYCRAAFGPAAGFAAGWLLWTATVLAAAALLNLFAALVAPSLRAAVIVGTGAGLTLLAAPGAARSTTASGALAMLKLILFAGVAIAGMAAPSAPASLPHGAPHPAAALVLVFFAFVGFERPTAMAGEVADARRALPFALIVGMIVVAVLYGGVITACWRALPGLAASDQPVGDLAARLFGPRLAGGLDVAAALIVLGTATSQWITAPRLLLAMSSGGQLPPILSRVAPRRRTPDVAIVVTGIIAVALALPGDFASSAAASSASRLLIFIGCAAALLRLRQRAGAPEARFRLWAGSAVATCVIVACAALLLASWAELGRLGVVIAFGGALWLISNRYRTL